MSDHRKTVDVARGLRLREKAVCFHAGSSGMPEKLVEDKILSTIIEGGNGGQRDHKRTENARLKTIRTEDAEIVRQIADNKKKEVPAEKVFDETLAARQVVQNQKTPPYDGLRYGAPAALLMGADGAFMLWAFFDVAGVDLTRGFGDVSLLLAVMLALVALLGVIVNSLAGFIATSPVSPRRRLVGWTLLLTIAITLGVMRTASTPETNFAFTILGCVFTVISGLATGTIQHILLPIIAAHRAHNHNVALAQKVEVEASIKLETLRSTIENLEARRRRLRTEIEDLASMPARRAARKAEIEKVQAARLKAARYYFGLGQRFAGRTPSDENKEMADA